jgi:predicted RNase H-like nuclease (RuvC/YqgF family)
MEGNFLTNFPMDIILFQFDQEQKIIDLEQEVSRLKQELLERKAQMVATGHDHDTAKLRQEVEKLKQDLQNSRVREQQLSRKLSSSSTRVSSPVLGKMKVIFRMSKITAWTVDLN